jgi:hypothetical protein
VIAAAHWRRGGAEGREQLAAPGDLTSLAKGYTPTQAYWGKITSKPPERLSKAEIELQAFRLGVKPAALRQLIASGVLHG